MKRKVSVKSTLELSVSGFDASCFPVTRSEGIVAAKPCRTLSYDPVIIWKLDVSEASLCGLGAESVAALLLVGTFPLLAPALSCTAAFFAACFVTGALSSFLLFNDLGTLAASAFSFFLLAIL